MNAARSSKDFRDTKLDIAILLSYISGMKRILGLALLCGALLLAGCKKADVAAAAASGPVTRANGIASITITGNDLMRYNVTAFTVHPGEKVSLTLANVGVMPLATMGHDLVILKSGIDYRQFASDVMAQKGESPNDYLPSSLEGDVIAHTRLLGPGEKQTIEFTAPINSGDYSYLCTFPTHFVFMHGVMTVK